MAVLNVNHAIPELGAIDLARRSDVKPKRALRPFGRTCCNTAAVDMNIEAVAGLRGTISKPDSLEPLRMRGQSGQADDDAYERCFHGPNETELSHRCGSERDKHY